MWPCLTGNEGEPQPSGGVVGPASGRPSAWASVPVPAGKAVTALPATRRPGLCPETSASVAVSCSRSFHGCEGVPGTLFFYDKYQNGMYASLMSLIGGPKEFPAGGTLLGKHFLLQEDSAVPES